MQSEYDFLLRFRKNQRTSLINIAKRLRSGDVSQEFLDVLALLIDPRIEENCFSLKLKPAYSRKAVRNPFLNAHIGKRYEELLAKEASEGRPRAMTKKVLHALFEEFGVERATVFAGLQALNDHRLLLEEIDDLKRAYPDQA